MHTPRALFLERIGPLSGVTVSSRDRVALWCQAVQGTVSGMQREGGKDLQETPRLVIPRAMWRKTQKLWVLPLKKKLGDPAFVHTDLTITQPCNWLLRWKFKSQKMRRLLSDCPVMGRLGSSHWSILLHWGIKPMTPKVFLTNIFHRTSLGCVAWSFALKSTLLLELTFT